MDTALAGHGQPFFAPIAAAISMGTSNGLRERRAVQLVTGVALGIVLGMGVQALLGTGAVSLGAAVFLALCAALVVGHGFIARGALFSNQTAVAAILVIALHRSATGPDRLIDALIGGGVALVFILLFPADPLPVIRSAVQSVFAVTSQELRQLDELMTGRGPIEAGWLLTASERISTALAGLDQARASARGIARLALLRRSSKAAVAQADQIAPQLAAVASAVLALGSLTVAAIDAGETSPCRPAGVNRTALRSARRRSGKRRRRRGRSCAGSDAGCPQRRAAAARLGFARAGHRVDCGKVRPPGAPGSADAPRMNACRETTPPRRHQDHGTGARRRPSGCSSLSKLSSPPWVTVLRRGRSAGGAVQVDAAAVRVGGHDPGRQLRQPLPVGVWQSGGKRLDPLAEPCGALLGELPAGIGDRYVERAAVDRADGAGDQAAALRAVDQAADRGLVQAEETAEFVHRRLPVPQHPEQPHLDDRQVVLPGDLGQGVMHQERQLGEGVHQLEIPARA
jgi:hypothetical protein